MAAPPAQFPVRVVAIETLTPLIKAFRLAAADGGTLPGFTPGAHVAVRIPAEPGGAERWRSYSLVTLSADADPQAPQADYLIAVRLEEAGTGGSRFLHERVGEGDELVVRAPANDFPLTEADDVVLVAGGIGVTPIAAMAAALVRAGRRFRLHYTCRGADQMAFRAELEALAGPALRVHFDDDPATAFSVEGMLASCRPGQPIYVCGPRGMIEALTGAARRRGWADADLHAELFTAGAPQSGDQPFEVVLQASGMVLPVPADRSLLDVLVDAGVFVAYDCRNGFCGLCTVTVLDGEIDHRDGFLLDEDKAGGRMMQICVSRARSPRLVLDL
ncbi:MAG TPA: PDR/VanB family oxidoreductase [Azospirillum sp.]|nr:PDR/VanB family oxidoreductase [Azospirillum sp.]